MPEAVKGKQFFNMTKEELAACGRAGAAKSAETRRRKRAMKDTLEVLLGLKLKPGKAADVEALKDFASLKGKNLSVEEAIMVAQIQKAMKGDTTAAAFIRDTSGNKPKDEVELAGSVPVVIAGDDEIED